MKTLIVLSLTIAITSNAAPKAPPVMPLTPTVLRPHVPALRSPKAFSLIQKRIVPTTKVSVFTTIIPGVRFVKIEYRYANSAPYFNSVDTFHMWCDGATPGDIYQFQWSPDGLKTFTGLSNPAFWVHATTPKLEFEVVVGNNTGSAPQSGGFFRVRDTTLGH